MEAATALGREGGREGLAQSIGPTATFQCLPGKWFHSPAECASKIQFKPAGLRCVTSLRTADEPLRSTFVTAERVEGTCGAAPRGGGGGHAGLKSESSSRFMMLGRLFTSQIETHTSDWGFSLI